VKRDAQLVLFLLAAAVIAIVALVWIGWAR